MTAKDLVNNFVSQFNKPFDLSMISNMIDRDPDEVKAELAELLTTEKIRLVDPEQGIYVRNNRYSARVSYNQKGDWAYDPMEASTLMDVIESGSFRSIRAIALSIGRSRQWVFIYLEALASIDCVSVNNGIYTVTGRDQIREIGKRIIPNILGQMRFEDGKESRLKRAAEKERKHKLHEAKKLERERQRLIEAERQEWLDALIKAWDKYWKTFDHKYFLEYQKIKSQEPVSK